MFRSMLTIEKDLQAIEKLIKILIRVDIILEKMKITYRAIRAL